MVKLFSFLTTLVMVATTLAQGYTPIRGIGIKAYPTQSGAVCIGCASGNVKNVIDADLNNFTNMGNLLSIAGGNGISVINSNITYPAGHIAGFNVDLGNSPLTSSLLSSITVATYRNGVLQDASTSSTLLSVPAFGGQKTRIFLHLQTTRPFNEVRLYKANGVALFDALNIYYAFAFDPTKTKVEDNKICDDLIGGSLGDVDTNVFSSSNFIAPLSYLYNRKNISDGDKKSAADIIMPISLLGSYSVGVLDKNVVYPAGNRAGFVISPADQNTLISLATLSYLTIETYLYGKLQDSQVYSDGSSLISLTIASFGSAKQKLSMKTTKPFNEVRLKVTKLAGVDLGTIRVFYAFEEPDNCDCKQYLQTDKTGAYNGLILTGAVPGGGRTLLQREQWTGSWNPFGGSITISPLTNPQNIVDANQSNRSTFYVAPFNIGTGGSVGVQGGTTYPAGTSAGFVIDKGGSLIDFSALSTIRISLYNGNTLVQSEISSNNGLGTLKLLTLPTQKTFVAISAKVPFNRMRITISQGLSLNLGQTYNIYSAFVEGDLDQDGTPDCYDQCPNGDDSKDSDGDGIPDACDIVCDAKDKSSVLDSDGDGIPDACDLDSDNDGILDSIENTNHDNEFDNDDLEGDLDLVGALGDGVPNYKDLDSDNDGLLDLFESGIPLSVINTIDVDNNGVIDGNITTGKNGFADVLETFPDSGIAKYPLKDTNGNGKPDYLDVSSNGSQFDLYAIDKENLDELGGGFITPIVDADFDGIMDAKNPSITNPADTNPALKGAPGSPLSPYTTTVGGRFSQEEIISASQDIKIYPNPVKAGDVLNVKGGKEALQYIIYSSDGKLVKSGNLSVEGTIRTNGLASGIYIVKVNSKSVTKSYKVIVK